MPTINAGKSTPSLNVSMIGADLVGTGVAMLFLRAVDTPATSTAFDFCVTSAGRPFGTGAVAR